MDGGGSGAPVGDSSSGDDLDDEGGRFPGLSDSIKVRRLRFSEVAESGAHGGRPELDCSLSVMSPVPSMAGGDGGSGVVLQRDGGDSGYGCDEDSPMMVVDALMGGLGLSSVAGGVAVHGLGGVDAPFFGGGPAFVAGEAPLAGSISSLSGIENPIAVDPIESLVVVQTSTIVAVDPIHRVSMNVSVPAMVPNSGHLPGPVPAGRNTSTRPAEAAAMPDVRKGKAGPSRSYAAVIVSDMKSNVILSFVPPVNSNGRKHDILCDSDCSVNDYHFSLTASGSRLAFAKVCVEIDASEEFIYEVPVTLGTSSCLVRLRYPWLPPRCGVCLAFGHESSSCASCRSSVTEVHVPTTTSLHGDPQPTAHALPRSSLMPPAGGSERTEVGGDLDGRGRIPDRTDRVSRERSVPRQLKETARSRSLSSDLSPPGTGRDPVRSPERSSDGFVAIRTKSPGKRGGRGRRRRGG
ncbi:hypothetical protein Dimus_008480 [Dionaea muscipula]